MIAWLHCKLQERRTRNAILSMVSGLLETTDDWERRHVSTPSAFTTGYKFTSRELDVTIRWTVRDFMDRDVTALSLTLDGVEQKLPLDLGDKIEDLIKRTEKRIKEIKADRDRREAEHKLASWVVKNEHRIRRAERTADLADMMYLKPGEFRAVEGPLTPIRSNVSRHIGHCWEGKKIKSYEVVPDWYLLEDGSKVPGSHVRQSMIRAY